MTVSLARQDGGLQLAVSDNGRGFDHAGNASQPSLGHVSMRERVRLVGGNVEVQSVPGQGTRVVAWVPLEKRTV